VWRARVQPGEYSWLTISGNFGDLLKTSVAQQAHGEIAALFDLTVFRCDRGLPNPLLQTLHVFVVLFGDLTEDRLEVFVICGSR
jgi:hypothetical protein